MKNLRICIYTLYLNFIPKVLNNVLILWFYQKPPRSNERGEANTQTPILFPTNNFLILLYAIFLIVLHTKFYLFHYS